ncbi:MAG: amino acid ABC transporter permease, partial [Clostridiales bacterium]|nr:amino acid ABC transporter permease [Clostridiales bacterium]
ILGTVLGTIIALMRLSDWNPIKKVYPLRILSTAFVDIIRGTPVVVQLMIMYYIILSSTNISREMIPLISFGINSAAYVSEMVRSGILAVEKGQTEAGRSLGLSHLQTLFLIVLPQSIQIILPNLFNEFIMLLKETSVVGFIGLMDLTKAGDFIRSRTYSAFFPLITVAVIYFLLITILTRIFALGEKKIRARS